MLPSHGYPELKKYKHLYGNYGSAWHNQKVEFAKFPGAILMTTGCMQRPQAYKRNIFTSQQAGYPGVGHIKNNDFTPLIEQALALPGFKEGSTIKDITVGFGHHSVKQNLVAIVEAVKKKQIRHFFLVGGCDGKKGSRGYFTDFVDKTPMDTVVLTLACGKFRFNKLELGKIGPFPRLLDVGQCNDAYGAIQIAISLAEAFGCEVNELPLSMVLSWYE